MTSQPAGPPGPGAPAPAGRRPPDPQTCWTRRAVAAGVGRPAVHLPVVVINACQDSRRKNSLRNYNREAAHDRQPVRHRGRRRRSSRRSRQGASQSPEDLQTQISSLRAHGRHATSSRPSDLSTPGDLDGAQQSLLIALELRRDGLQYISERIATALGNEGDVADQAIEGITGQMQAFLASDVLIRTRVTPLVRDALKDNDVVAEPAGDQGLPARLLVAAARLRGRPARHAPDQRHRRRRPDTGQDRARPARQRPRLHQGQRRHAAARTRRPTASRSAGDLTFMVEFAEPGREQRVRRPGPGHAAGRRRQGHHRQEDGRHDRQGRRRRPSTSRCSRKPTAGEVYTVNVEVKPVPGEKKTDNNKSTYNVLFQ